MNFYTQNTQQQSKPKVSDSERTRKELSAQKQLSRFDEHFNDPDTVVSLDKVTSSRDGELKTRYIVSKRGREKYVAKFTVRNNKQKLEEIASLKRTKKKIKPAQK